MGLAADAGIDWLKSKTVNHESICDEGVTGIHQSVPPMAAGPAEGTQNRAPGRPSGRQGRLRVVAIRRPTLLAGALLAGAFLGGCQPVSDPGDTLTYMVLVNDVGVAVDVRWCGDPNCNSFPGTTHDRLEPGGRLSVNVSGEGLPDYYRIKRDDRPGQSCLRVSVKDEPPRSVVPLSSSYDCTHR